MGDTGSSPARRPRAELRVGRFARFDLGRPERTGAPEVILAEGKHPEEVVGLLRSLHARGRGALVSRPGPDHTRALLHARADGLPLTFRARGRLVQLRGPILGRPAEGTVALLTAGTSDLPVADEAAAVLAASGARLVRADDVGVAGLHRLERALVALARSRPKVYLVFAGREGALPTVVAGLVPAPVVGVPTSNGYGRGGRGEAALGAMLQSCAPVAVVNIDAAVPAALFALQLLRASR